MTALSKHQEADQGICSAVGITALLSICISLGLLLHHKIKHSQPGAHYIPDSCEQWFQYKIYPDGDVCNFTTCSHEMWILFLVVLGLGAVVVVIGEGC